MRTLHHWITHPLLRRSSPSSSSSFALLLVSSSAASLPGFLRSPFRYAFFSLPHPFHPVLHSPSAFHFLPLRCCKGRKPPSIATPSSVFVFVGSRFSLHLFHSFEFPSLLLAHLVKTGPANKRPCRRGTPVPTGKPLPLVSHNSTGG